MRKVFVFFNTSNEPLTNSDPRISEALTQGCQSSEVVLVHSGALVTACSNIPWIKLSSDHSETCISSPRDKERLGGVFSNHGPGVD